MVTIRCRTEQDANTYCEYNLTLNTLRPVIICGIRYGTLPSGQTAYYPILGEQEDPVNPNQYIVPSATSEFLSGDQSLYEQIHGLQETSFFKDTDLGGNGHYRGYWWIRGLMGNTTILNAVYEFNTLADMITALDNGELHPTLPSRVYFDVYVNGSDQPNIFVNWTGNEDLSPVILSPKIWFGVDSLVSLLPEFVTDAATGLQVPNTENWWIEDGQEYAYAGSLNSSYQSIYNQFEKYLNPVSKVEMWGFDGVPALVRLYMRIDYDDEIGTLYRVAIEKDGTATATAISNSGNTQLYETVVRLHTGEPSYIPPDDDTSYTSGTNIDDTDDGRYAEVPDTNYFSDNDGQGFDGNAVLTRTYAISAATLANIGQKLWSQSYFDVLKIQSNPIENIISVKAFPFAMTGASEQIKVGDVPFGINGDKVSSLQVYDIGSVKYKGYFGSYLDLSPYTITKINLPYIGQIQLDASDLFNSTLAVKYIIDLVTGQCMAKLTLDNIPYMNVFGQMGVDIPLTSSDRVQTEIRAASAAISAVGSSAGQMMTGNVGGGLVTGISGALNIAGADLNSQRTSNQSPACSTYENHGVFLIIDRPLGELNKEGQELVESVGYKHLHGYPCHKFLTLGELAVSDKSMLGGGFVQVDARSDIKIAMTSEENALLESLLTTGVYV